MKYLKTYESMDTEDFSNMIKSKEEYEKQISELNSKIKNWRMKALGLLYPIFRDLIKTHGKLKSTHDSPYQKQQNKPYQRSLLIKQSIDCDKFSEISIEKTRIDELYVELYNSITNVWVSLSTQQIGNKELLDIYEYVISGDLKSRLEANKMGLM